MKNVALRLLFVAALQALAGCDASLSLIEVRQGCPDKPLRGPAAFPPASPDDVIDDFEDNDLWLSKVAGRTGSWVGYGTPGMGTVRGEVSDECVASGKFSAHLTGTNLNPFGGNWNGVFIDPFSQAVAFDATSYSGISFWVATGENAVPPLVMPIGIMTTDTSYGAGICTSSCADYYRWKGGVPLTRVWTRWEIKFSDMAQSGMGFPQVVPMRKNKLVTIMIWPQNTYDIWLDDVRFEK